METILLGIFIAGYLLITLEHSLRIDKLIPALGMMAFLWAIIAVFNIPVFEVDTQLRELIPTKVKKIMAYHLSHTCLLYTSPSPRDKRQSRMPSSA